ncbi:cation transport regulator ChaB [Rhizobium sp. SG570]|nr:cation transport regulator ChaB [Rhizobium sp. SG570]
MSKEMSFEPRFMAGDQRRFCAYSQRLRPLQPCRFLRRMTSMPYNSIGELPPSVGNHLPIHAQEIYRAAFNNAWEEYADRGRVREQIAHRVAWAAVKRLYVKQRDEWISRA